MKPSATSPVRASAFGPYAATHTSSSLAVPHGNCNVEPWYSAGRPFASSRTTPMHSRNVARLQGRPLVTRTAECCFMPVTVGGGIRTVADMRTMLLAGADKVGINTAAVFNPTVID